MTTMTQAEVEAYLHAVTQALSDLEPELRADLLDELPDHLNEVAAEGGASLADRLGDPLAYAAELRAAAVVLADPDRRSSRTEEISRTIRSGIEMLGRADIMGGRVLGYSRATQFLTALRPGWWVLRGWVFARLLSFTYGNRNSSLIPNFGNGYSNSSKTFGLVFLACCVLASIRIGRASARWSLGARRVTVVVSLLLGLYTLRAAERTTEFGFSLTSSSVDVEPASSASPSAGASAASSLYGPVPLDEGPGSVSANPIASAEPPS